MNFLRPFFPPAARGASRSQVLTRVTFPSQGKGFRVDRSTAVCLNAISKLLSCAPKMARQRQTSCEAGTQSRGPLVGSRAAERRRSDTRMCHPRGRRDSSRLGREISLVRKSILFLPATVPGPVRRTRGGTLFSGSVDPMRTPWSITSRCESGFDPNGCNLERAWWMRPGSRDPRPVTAFAPINLRTRVRSQFSLSFRSPPLARKTSRGIGEVTGVAFGPTSVRRRRSTPRAVGPGVSCAATRCGDPEPALKEERDPTLRGDRVSGPLEEEPRVVREVGTSLSSRCPVLQSFWIG